MISWDCMVMNGDFINKHGEHALLGNVLHSHVKLPFSSMIDLLKLVMFNSYVYFPVNTFPDFLALTVQ